ncbi:MAG: hypothetical protein IT210_11325 [Armatimonadetes bacterium]|nr:hypothetical protein [Armatimonadota bacterium]
MPDRAGEWGHRPSGSALDERWSQYAVNPAAAREARERLPENALYARYFNDGATPGYITWDFGFQGNLTSVDRLIAARQNPDAHRDLMVRVGGFSARFCSLPRETQDEIISRYRYGASDSR